MCGLTSYFLFLFPRRVPCCLADQYQPIVSNLSPKLSPNTHLTPVSVYQGRRPPGPVGSDVCGLLVFIHYTLALPSPANLNPEL